MNIEHLTAEDGYLYFRGTRLLCIYPAGDCDNIRWPLGTKQNAENLVSALYDMGNTRDDLNFPIKIMLPDGVQFGRLVACGFNPDFDFHSLPNEEDHA